MNTFINTILETFQYVCTLNLSIKVLFNFISKCRSKRVNKGVILTIHSVMTECQ